MFEQNLPTGSVVCRCANNHFWLSLLTNSDKTEEIFLQGQNCSICKGKAVEYFDEKSEVYKKFTNAMSNNIEKILSQEIPTSQIDMLTKLKR